MRVDLTTSGDPDFGSVSFTATGMQSLTFVLAAADKLTASDGRISTVTVSTPTASRDIRSVSQVIGHPLLT
jgi:hypothetical protein